MQEVQVGLVSCLRTRAAPTCFAQRTVARHLRLVCNRFGKHDSKGGRPCWRHDAFDPQKYPLHALPADVKAAPHAFISVDLSVVGRKLVRKNLNMFAERHWRYSDLFYSLQRNRQHSNV